MSWLSKLLGNGSSSEKAGSAHRHPVIPGAHLLIDRHEYPLVELGVRSFRVHPYEGELIETQNLSFVLTLSVGDEDISIPGHGIVRSITDRTGLTAQFNAPQPFLDRKLIEFLTHLKSHGKPRQG